MVLNLSVMPSSKISSYTSNSIAHQDRIAASTYAGGTNSRSKTIQNQKDRLCALEACMVSWPRRRNSRASRENGRPTTSRSLDEWSPLYKMVRPLLTSRKFQVSQAGPWIVTKNCPDRPICRVVKLATSLFGTSRLRQRGDLVSPSEHLLRRASAPRNVKIFAFWRCYGGKFSCSRFCRFSCACLLHAEPS